MKKTFSRQGPDRTSKIVCLCGSTSFKEQFEEVAKIETLKLNIVLTVGYFGHKEKTQPTLDLKKELDMLHLKKIDLADEIVIITINNYIGTSTAKEIQYAKKTNKPIRYVNFIDF